MGEPLQRRGFLKQSAGLAVAAAVSRPGTALGLGEVRRREGTRVKIALNAYSFNRPLSEGRMTLDDVIDYCAEHGIDGVDPTGYYFPGYPEAPSDEYLYNLKRKAFLNGVTLGGTGVRNDFALADADARRGHIQLVKRWIEAAEKMGAAFVRVFSGRQAPSGHSFDQVLEWMIPAFQQCAEHGKRHGVIVALQHHDDFLKTAAETIRVVEAVGSEWFSVVLDVGSLRQGDPYEEIERLVPYACTWQVKEDVWYGEKRTPIDLRRLKAIIDRTGYRGFLPVEALGRGDPKEVVTKFLKQVREVFG
jgi:sugar phosphate isomerase/epimerase